MKRSFLSVLSLSIMTLLLFPMFAACSGDSVTTDAPGSTEAPASNETETADTSADTSEEIGRASCRERV